MHDNRAAVQELTALAPYPGKADQMTIERNSIQRKWVMFYGGLTFGRTDFKYDANAWALSPDYTVKDLDAEGDGSLLSLQHLIGWFSVLDHGEVTRFRCPIILFEGRHDYAVSHLQAAAWFRHIRAPSKNLIWFEDSAHMVFQEEPGRFLFPPDHRRVPDRRPGMRCSTACKVRREVRTGLLAGS